MRPHSAIFVLLAGPPALVGYPPGTMAPAHPQTDALLALASDCAATMSDALRAAASLRASLRALLPPQALNTQMCTPDNRTQASDSSDEEGGSSKAGGKSKGKGKGGGAKKKQKR